MEKRASKWKTETGDERKLWTFLGFNQLIELATKEKGPINFWEEIFKKHIEEAGFIEKQFWMKSMNNMSKPRNPKSHGVKNDFEI